MNINVANHHLYQLNKAFVFVRIYLINLVSWSLIRLKENVVSIVEKSYVDKLDSRKHLDSDLLMISSDYIIDQNRFYHTFHIRSSKK